jgi:precorrin-6A/cobalt-precorrin-6A reductase
MILVLGGTTEGRELAIELQRAGYTCMLSVTTELGARMVAGSQLKIQIGQLDGDGFNNLLRQEQIQLIIDATHPYAEIIKLTAANAAKAAGITYIRLERQAILLPNNPEVVTVNDYTEALAVLRKEQGGVLFTIGVKNLYCFKSLWLELHYPVWVKIYPEVESLKASLELGLLPEQIVAFHGPGNIELLKAILKMYGVSWIVTKDSGITGGVDIKVTAALETGRKILVIKRPLTRTKLTFQNVGEIIEFVKTNFPK